MKPLKKASQRNAEVNRGYYTDEEYWNLKLFSGVSTLKEATGLDFAGEELRVFFEDCKEIKVVLDENGHYTNAAVLNNGLSVYINL